MERLGPWPLAFAAVVGVLCASCVPAPKVVDLASSPYPSDIALVKGHQFSWGTYIFIESVDRNAPSSGMTPAARGLHAGAVRLSPGVYTLEVSWVSGNEHSTTNAALTLNAEAGHTYEIQRVRVPFDSKWESFSYAMFGGHGHWVAWIVDVKSGAVVAGKRPDFADE